MIDALIACKLHGCTAPAHGQDRKTLHDGEDSRTDGREDSVARFHRTGTVELSLQDGIA